MVDPSKGTVVATFQRDPVNPATAGRGGNPGAGIAQGTGADWFGPLNPLSPTAPEEVRGRQFDFPSGYNLSVYPKAYEGLPYWMLRNLADSYDVLRIVIETRKDQMARMKWRIVPRHGEQPEAGTGKRPENKDPRIDMLTAFFKRPDKEHRWDGWLRMLLEDLFVIDAASLYRYRTRGGGLYALQPLDGGTIKRVIDDWGRTPAEPAPAYQQVLKGLPAVDYARSDLYYLPRNPRTNKVYGYSPVEQIIVTINIALNRENSTLQYFTEGNIPEALIGVPDSWTPDQIKQFQEWWDTILAGNTGQRRHAKFVPAGVGKTYIETRDPDLKNVFDEWLARVVCFCFSIPATPFVAQVNRATADSAKEQSEEDGLVPIQDWVKGFMDDCLEQDFGAPDLEFQWIEDEETDPKTSAEIGDILVKSARYTIDEDRIARGLQPFGGLAATPMVWTTTGYLPLDAFQQQQQAASDARDAQAAALAEAKKNPPQPAGGASGGAQAGGSDKGVGKAAGAPFVKAHGKGKVGNPPGPLPWPRPTTSKAVTAMRDAWGTALSDQKAAALAAGAAMDTAMLVQGATGVPDATAVSRLVALLELTAPAAGTLAAEYEKVATESGELAYAQVGSTEDVFDKVNAPAAAWAQERAGTLISNVDETTRGAIRDTISAGLTAGLTNDEIAAKLGELYAFSPERAQLIAYTEIAAANSQGALTGYKTASAEGVKLGKAWLLGENPCDECQDNADAGTIGLDEVFPSGDDAPPAHPNCECALTPVVIDDGGDETEGGEE